MHIMNLLYFILPFKAQFQTDLKLYNLIFFTSLTLVIKHCHKVNITTKEVKHATPIYILALDLSNLI